MIRHLLCISLVCLVVSKSHIQLNLNVYIILEITNDVSTISYQLQIVRYISCKLLYIFNILLLFKKRIVSILELHLHPGLVTSSTVLPAR